MKKSNILLALMIVFSLVLSACGTPDPFEGKWVGTYDMTDIVMDALMQEEGAEEYLDYFELENLAVKVNLIFEDGTITVVADKDSVEALIVSLETSLYNMMDTMVREALIQMYHEMFDSVNSLEDVAGLTNGMYETGQEILDDVAINQGYPDYDTFIKDSVASAKIREKMTEACEKMNLFGEYGFDEKKGLLAIYYGDNVYEEMQYKFVEDSLVIYTIADGMEMELVCERASE